MEDEIKIIINNPMFTVNNRSITILFPDGEIETYQGASPANVIHLTNKYNVGTVYIKGNKRWNQKLVKEIKEEEALTYRDNILEFEYIK